MSILVLDGSHSNGNTRFMLDIMVKQLGSLHKDRSIEVVNLKDKNISFCEQGDYTCKQIENCHCARDDMKQIYQKLLNAQYIILASPVYFYNVSARMKNFMDRCCPFIWTQKLKSKSVFLIGDGQQEKNQQFFTSLEMFCKSLGMKVVDRYYATANQIQNKQNLTPNLKTFCKKIVTKK